MRNVISQTAWGRCSLRSTVRLICTVVQLLGHIFIKIAGLFYHGNSWQRFYGFGFGCGRFGGKWDSGRVKGERKRAEERKEGAQKTEEGDSGAFSTSVFILPALVSCLSKIVKRRFATKNF